MTFRLPTIDKTKPQQQSQQYNFVNTNQRRRTKDLITPPVTMVSTEDLKKKIQEQKRQIQTRNNAIMALQRNFQSMAALLKTEKGENNGLRDEVEKWKKVAEENGRKVENFHERNIQLGNDVKKGKEEIGRLNEEIRTLMKMNEQYQANLKVIDTLTKQNKKLQNNINDMSSQKQQLINELKKFNNVEKQRKQYEGIIFELKQEIRILNTEKDGLLFKIEQLQEANRILDVNIKNSDNEKDNLRKRGQQDKSKEIQSNGEIAKLKNKIYSLQQQLLKVRTQAQNKNVIIMMKMKTQQQLKTTMNDLKMKITKNQTEISQKVIDNEELNKKVVDIEQKYQKLKEQFKNERRKNELLVSEVSKGEGKDQQLQNAWKELKQTRDTVIDLETKLREGSQQYNRLRLIVEKYEEYFEEIDACNPCKILAIDEYQKMKQRIQGLEGNVGENQIEVNSLNKKLRSQEGQVMNLRQRLGKYQNSDRELSELLGKEKQMLQGLEREKRIKEQQMLKERQKNKLLWSDNKKLKENEERMLQEIEVEKQEMRIKSQKELKRVEEEKRAELEEKERVLREEYQKQFEMLRSNSNSNNNEVSLLLKKKGQMIRELEDKVVKTVEQVQFYKNRLKQLQGVSSRTDKKMKQLIKSHEQKIQQYQLAHSDLSTRYQQIETTHKSCTQTILSLTNRLSSLQQFKKQHSSILQQSKQYTQKLKSLQSQILSLRKKLQPYQSQDIVKKRQILNTKIQLLLKSVNDLSQSLTSIRNHISCSYCCELPTETMKMIPCGHVFCKKCKTGYDDVCEECKKGGNVVQDKVHDQTVTKLNYMQMVLVSVREDTVILGKL